MPVDQHVDPGRVPAPDLEPADGGQGHLDRQVGVDGRCSRRRPGQVGHRSGRAQPVDPERPHHVLEGHEHRVEPLDVGDTVDRVGVEGVLDAGHAHLQALAPLVDRVDQAGAAQQAAHAWAAPEGPVDGLQAFDHPAEGRRILQVGPVELARGRVELTEYPLGFRGPPLRWAAEDCNDAAHGPEGRAKPGATTPAAPRPRSPSGRCRR